MRTSDETTRVNASAIPAAALLASAFVLLALIVVRVAPEIGRGSAALGEMAAVGADYTMVTTEGGNEELLYVLHNRNGKLFVYEAKQAGKTVLLDVVDGAEVIARIQQRSNP